MKMERTMDPEKTNLLRGKRNKKSFGTRNITEHSSDSNSLSNEIPAKYNIDRPEKKRYKADSVVDTAVNITRGTGEAGKRIDMNSDTTPSCIDSCIMFGKEVEKFIKLCRSSGIKKKIFKRKLNAKFRSHSVGLVMLAVMVAVFLVSIALVFNTSTACSAAEKDSTKGEDQGGMFKSGGSDGKYWGKRDNSLDNFMKDGDFRFSDASLRESNSFMPGMMSDELTAIIDPGIINDQSSSQLRDFYRRLLQTGEKLNRLKTKLTEDAPDINNVLKISPYRRKRSLKYIRIPRNLFNKSHNNVTGDVKRKSDTNNTDFGIVIEKAKVFVQYLNNDKKNPNAIETAQETAKHINEVKEPFHKNSHKFDAVFNLILDRNARTLPDSVKTQNDVNKAQELYFQKTKEEETVQMVKDNKESAEKVKNDLKLSQNIKKESINIDKHVQRKLLQVNEDSHTDVNDKDEVISEQKEIVDTKASSMRNSNTQILSKETNNNIDYAKHSKDTPKFLNQVAGMIENIVLQNLYSRTLARRNTDNDYNVEEGQDNDANNEYYDQVKFEDSNNFAQAYSDYGVLDSKKEKSNEIYSDDDNRAEKRVKLSIETTTSQTTTTSKCGCQNSVLSDASNKIANILKNIKSRLDTKKSKEDAEPQTDECSSQQFIKSHKQTTEEHKKSKDKTKHSVNLDLMQFTQRGKRTLKSVDEIDSTDNLASLTNPDEGTASIDGANEIKSIFDIGRINKTDVTTETTTMKQSFHAYNNIEFRTRTLLSTDKEKVIDVDKMATNIEITTENEEVKKAKNAPTNPAIELKAKNETATKQDHQPNKLSNELKATTEQVAKNVVKRSAVDDGSIFWEDVYDDEYGMDFDENKRRDKFTIKEEFVKKSDWFHNKVQKLKDRWRANRNNVIMNVNKTKNGSSDEKGLKEKTVVKRAIGNEKKSRASSHNTDFAALTANMKEVCKNAADAIQKTRSIKVRGESTESQQSVSLMQQLASLMNDLVNFQVQEKTCLKLTPDLRNFLAWLTLPGQQQTGSSFADDSIFSDTYPGPFNTANAPSYQEAPIDNAQAPDAMETLQSVQDLLGRYQKMSDDDKSKMSGVKEYLENKEKLLSSHISGYDDIYNQVKSLRYRRNNPLKLKKRPRKFRHFSNESKQKKTEVPDDKKQNREKKNK